MASLKSTIAASLGLWASQLGFSAQAPVKEQVKDLAPVTAQATPPISTLPILPTNTKKASSEDEDVLPLIGKKAKESIQDLYDGHSEILLVGNNHYIAPQQREFALSLEGLRAKGIRNVALEMSENHQDTVNAYLGDLKAYHNGKISRETFEKSRGSMIKFFHDHYAKGSPYLDVETLDEAGRLGMEVRCIDSSDNEPVTVRINELQKKKESLSATIKKDDKSGDNRGYVRAVDEYIQVDNQLAEAEKAELRFRNTHMAERLAQISEENGPVVAMVGAYHTGKGKQGDGETRTVETELDSKGKTVMSIDLKGGELRLIDPRRKTEEGMSDLSNHQSAGYGGDEATDLLYLPDVVMKAEPTPRGHVNMRSPGKSKSGGGQKKDGPIHEQ